MVTLRVGDGFVFQFVAIPFLLLSFGAWNAAMAQEQPKELSPAEKFVLAEVGSGRVANLRDRFPNEKDRGLSAGFVENLLMGRLKDTKIQPFGVRVQYGVLRERLDLENAEVEHETRLDNCQFEAGIDLSGGQFDRDLSFDGSTFTGVNANADFNTMKVKGSAFFENVVFAGPVNFSYAEIGGIFGANQARFTNHEVKANHEVNASFNTVKVGQSVFLDKAVFAGSVDFTLAEIGGNFEANEAQFTNSETEANFNTMKVEHYVFLNKTVFAGPVDFRYADIGGNLEANEAHISESGTEAQFDYLRVGGTGVFEKVFLRGPFSLVGAELQDLTISGSPDTDVVQLESLDLSLAVIRRDLRIQDLHVKEMTTTGLRVQGPTTLSALNVERTANLEYSRFVTLSLDPAPRPTDRDGLRLEGMTYERADAGSWKDTLDWLDASKYSTQPYLQLETVLRTQGDPEHADDVYVAMKKRESREVYKALLSLGWWKNKMLYLLVRYGRSPQWAFYWSALVIFVGFWVFRRRQDVEPRKPTHGAMPYNPFWFSLSLFLPVINLDAADIWMARQDSCFRRHYARVHILLGWMLIPIGLAAITGIIK